MVGKAGTNLNLGVPRLSVWRQQTLYSLASLPSSVRSENMHTYFAHPRD